MGYFCQLCEVKFNNEKAFKEHLNSFHIGSVSFNTVGGFQYTFSRSSDGLFRCPACPAVIRNADLLYTHLSCIYELPSYKKALEDYKRLKGDVRQIHN